MIIRNKEKFFKGEVILVYFHNEPAFFARVEDMLPDRKKGWWRLTFLVLALPLQTYTWILDDEQMCGADFTMGGNPVRIERVEAPQQTVDEKADNPEQKNSGTVVSMFGEE